MYKCFTWCFSSRILSSVFEQKKIVYDINFVMQHIKRGTLGCHAVDFFTL